MIHANVDRLYTRYQQHFGCTVCLGTRPGGGGATSDAAVYRATTLPYFQTNPTVEELLAPTNTYEDLSIFPFVTTPSPTALPTGPTPSPSMLRVSSDVGVGVGAIAGTAVGSVVVSLGAAFLLFKW